MDCSPWNSPDQNNGVGSLSLLHGIFPGLQHCRRILYQLRHKGSPRILEEVAYPFSSGSSWPRNQTGVSCIAGGFFTNWAMREAHTHSLIFPKFISYSQPWVFLGIGSTLSLLAVVFFSTLYINLKYCFSHWSEYSPFPVFWISRYIFLPYPFFQNFVKCACIFLPNEESRFLSLSESVLHK